jgi:hypothetical protein
MNQQPTLFDGFRRTDPAPRYEMEDSFTFLNRVSTPYWEQIRKLLEGWFNHYPEDGRTALRAAFRSSLKGHHIGAWWELYLHELFLRLGYQVSLHPTLPGTERKPDFELRRGDSKLLVEATVSFSGFASSGRRNAPPPWLLSAIETVNSPGFYLHFVRLHESGNDQLKVSHVRDPLESWLNQLDPDQVAATHEEGEGFPSTTITRRGWSMTFEAIPVSKESRGRPNHRVLAVHPGRGGAVDDIGQLRGKLKDKATRYGNPTTPFVIAVLASSAFIERLDVEQALFGSEVVVLEPDSPNEAQLARNRDGFWTRRDGPQHRRVSAVLLGINLFPWLVTQNAPELWTNPWARRPLNGHWPFSLATTSDTGVTTYRNSDIDLPALFDLDEDWPIGEPFPR